jgi:nucleotide-binding universal stress UspA family protein
MRVLLAVDGSACSEAAVEMVADRFRPEGTHVKVIHAVEWMREMPLCFQYAHGTSAGEDVAECRNNSFDRARLLVGRIAAQLEFKGFRTSVLTPDADPRHAIIETATDWPADLIVMGSHGRRGFDRLLLGSLAESVMRHAPCSVEIVRVSVADTDRELLHVRQAGTMR